MAARCLHGHPVDPDFAYCPRCGAPAATDEMPAMPRQGSRGGDVAAAGTDGTPPGEEDSNHTMSPSPAPAATVPGWHTWLAAQAAAGAGERTDRTSASSRAPWTAKRPRRLALGALATVALLGGASTLFLGGTRTITGELELTDDYSGFSTYEPTCEGSSGYDDIHAGATVLVKDGDGTVLATGFLDPGTPGPANYTSNMSYTCTFTFKVPDVPEANFYDIGLGSRGGLTYSAAELEANDWQVFASLG